MTPSQSYNHCKAFIEAHTSPSRRRTIQSTRPFVTISREAGSGGSTVARNLAELMNERSSGLPHPAWAVFDRALAEKVLADHHLPQRIARYMNEDANKAITSAIEETLGLHPSVWTLVEQTAETILKLAYLGNVIIVGRGASLVTRRLAQGVHVRLVGTLERRIQHTMEAESLDYREAKKRVQRRDQQRRAYVRNYFNQYIEDPTLYHLVINTDLVSYRDAAVLIAEEILRRRIPAE